MHCIRNTSQRLPQVYRIVPARNAHIYRNTMSLFPRFTQEFTPLFRILDDYERASRHLSNNWGGLQSFQPKFDVRETKEAYELNGELPGIDQKNVSIEWKNGNTLSITGRTEKHIETSSKPEAASTTAIEDEPKASGAIEAEEPDYETVSNPASESNYHKASVADEGAEETASTVAEEQATPATAEAGEVAPKAPEQVAAPAEPKYWVSERSVGEFARSFSFPVRVDHEAVKASLKNGILSIIVPKAQIPKPRKIEIE